MQKVNTKILLTTVLVTGTLSNGLVLVMRLVHTLSFPLLFQGFDLLSLIAFKIQILSSFANISVSLLSVNNESSLSFESTSLYGFTRSNIRSEWYLKSLLECFYWDSICFLWERVVNQEKSGHWKNEYYRQNKLFLAAVRKKAFS